MSTRNEVEIEYRGYQRALRDLVMVAESMGFDKQTVEDIMKAIEYLKEEAFGDGD